MPTLKSFALSIQRALTSTKALIVIIVLKCVFGLTSQDAFVVVAAALCITTYLLVNKYLSEPEDDAPDTNLDALNKEVSDIKSKVNALVMRDGFKIK